MDAAADLATLPESGPGADGRLTGAAEWFWYVIAAVTYIGFGIWHKWLLSWIVGPAWLVVTVTVGPALVRSIGRLVSRGHR
jgi:hypothetical protein